ncbi:ABC transporter permease [Nocardioides sp.]|uniref:ABC transporter permease n=1 Tax=Nocardioides sp. TaxID=35761 RepID=UPI0039E2811B
MRFFWQGLQQAWRLILDHDPYLWGLIDVTLRVTLVATVVAVAVGLPVGLALGLGRFRGRGPLVVLANAGLGLPPVIVGVVLLVLTIRVGPLGWTGLAFTMRGVYVAQAILALPVVVALTVAAVREVAPGLAEQARAFGARRHRVALLVLWESRIGVLAAVIAAACASLSEVGAVAIIGGNTEWRTQTLASAALAEVGAGRYASALAIGMVLLTLILVLTAPLTVLQYAGKRRVRAA